MILKFFKKEEQPNKDSDLINVACLMIHAAKIDENYTDKEKTIIKNTLKKLNKNTKSKFQGDNPFAVLKGLNIK